jgi:glycosyltransferase involved in cell wall biosynthesis
VIVSNKIKVLHIIYDLSVAGAQTVVMNYLRGLKDDSNYEMKLIVRDPSHNSENDIVAINEGLSVKYCNYKPYLGIPGFRTIVNWLRCQKLFYKEIKEFQPDIIHTHLTDILPFVLIPAKMSKAKCYVHTLHSDPYAIAPRFVKWAKKAFNKYGFYPVCVTESQAKKAVELYGFTDYSVVHNGIDLARFEIGESQEGIRKTLGIAPNSYVIGCVGRFSKIKNYGFLINVFAEYKKRNNKAVLLLVGDGEEKKHCMELVEKLCISDSVVFAGQHQDVERMYKAMDVFMLTSFYESNSIVTVEAQCAGLRCVVADSVPSSVVATDGVNRISFDEPIERWVNAIDGKVACEITESYLDDFSMNHTIDELKEVYKKLLGGKH